jgi:hypothetical protein
MYRSSHCSVAACSIFWSADGFVIRPALVCFLYFGAEKGNGEERREKREERRKKATLPARRAYALSPEVQLGASEAHPNTIPQSPQSQIPSRSVKLSIIDLPSGTQNHDDLPTP